MNWGRRAGLRSRPSGRGADVEPEEDLHQERRAAEEPDVDPRRTRDERVRREAHHGEERSRATIPIAIDDRRELERLGEPAQDRVDASGTGGRPATRSLRFCTIETDDARRRRSRMATRHPAARMTDRDRPDLVGRDRRSGPARSYVSLIAPLIFGFEMAPALHAPLLQDLLVRALLHEVLDGREHRLRHPVALRQRDPVRRRAVRLADELELARGTAGRCRPPPASRPCRSGRDRSRSRGSRRSGR